VEVQHEGSITSSIKKNGKKNGIFSRLMMVNSFDCSCHGLLVFTVAADDTRSDENQDFCH
jgi:hypothetical protein